MEIKFQINWSLKIFSVQYLVVYQKTFLKCLRYFNNFKWTILIVAADENIIEDQLALIFIFGMRPRQCFFYTICVLFLFNFINFHQSQLPVLFKLTKNDCATIFFFFFEIYSGLFYNSLWIVEARMFVFISPFGRKLSPTIFLKTSINFSFINFLTFFEVLQICVTKTGSKALRDSIRENIVIIWVMNCNLSTRMY